MEDWKTTTLGEIAQIIMGQSPDSKYYNSDGIGVKFLQGCAEFGNKYPNTAIYCSGPKKIAPKNSILFSVRAPVGKINFADTSYCIGRGLASIIPQNADLHFVYQYLGFIADQYQNITQGSTFGSINSEELKNFKLSIPQSRADQIQIAAILATIDKAIEQTEAIIAKQQRIKTGLMHDLLTKGIDEQSNIRSEATHQFKDSPLGRIPVEWEVDKLVNRISFPLGQVDPRVQPYRDMILVAPDHIEQRTGRLLARETAAQQNAISGKYLFTAGDVVYTKIRPYLRKVILAQEQGICSADMYPMRAQGNLTPRFLLAIILSEPFSRFAEIVSDRSGFPKINRSELSEYYTAFPQINEQDRICVILDKCDQLAEYQAQSLKKYQLLKNGLMQDLLTGNVRVTQLISAHSVK